MRASLLTFLLACVIRAYAGVILPTPQSVTPLPGEFRATASLWTDYALTMDLLDNRLYPRIYALAEQMWHMGERLPMQQFLQKIREHNAQSCK